MMRKLLSSILLLFFLFVQYFVCAQEFKNLRKYEKSTGQTELQEGCWIKKDRKRNSERWKAANVYNLAQENGNVKYTTIAQKHDFYLWFDAERKVLGHEINGIGVVAIVAGQLSNFERFFVRKLIIHNKEAIWFAQEGSTKVLEFFHPLLRDVYFSETILKGQAAKDWDMHYGKIEQCEIVEAIYAQLSPKAVDKLEHIAKGKGIYSLVVKKRIRFEGDIRKCHARCEHAFTKLLVYYLEEK